MPKNLKISEEDLAAFQQAMVGIKPLKLAKVRISPVKPTIKPKKLYEKMNEKAKGAEEFFHFSESAYLDPVSSEQMIEFKHESISNKILRKLRKGQYNVDAILDLHRLTVDEARVEVGHFISQCLLEKMRVILIIHGKGRHSQMPILKNKLNHWLRETNTILAFCSAAPAHGSQGAMYALLKRTSLEENFS